jgi:hypothetical protein
MKNKKYFVKLEISLFLCLLYQYFMIPMTLTEISGINGEGKAAQCKIVA